MGLPVAILAILAVLGLPRRAGAGPTAALPPLPPIPSVLAMDEAVRLFRAYGLDLLISDAAVEAARADVRTAGAVANPTVNGAVYKSYGYDPNDPTYCPPGGGCSDVGWSVGLSDQALWDVVSGKRGLRLKVARAALEAARLGRRDAERTLVSQVKQQVVQVAMGQRTVEFVAEVADAARQTAELNGRRYQVGAISEVDLSKAETDHLQALQALDNARNALRVARIGLAFLLGARGPVSDFSVDFDLRQRDDAALGDSRREGLIATALRSRPDLQAQARQLERAEASLSGARRQVVPDVSLNLGYQQQGTGQTAIQPPTVTVGAALTLPLFNQNQGPIAHARADIQQQSAQLAKLQAQVVSDVETSWAALDLNRRLLGRLENGLLERARVTRDLQRLRYQKGAASLLEYLDAQRVYIASYEDYFQALANYFTARFQLEQAVGY